MTTVTNQLNTGATPIAVSQGGVGINTLTTAYAPVCAGSAATSHFQPADSGLSNSGYILCSNGSSVVPSFYQQPIVVTTVTVATADVQNMYATPFQILAAQGAHTIIVVYNMICEFIYNTTAFGGTGAGFGIQYNNTNHGGGIGIFQPQYSITTANSKVAYGNCITLSGIYSGITGNIVNQGLYITNQVGAYTGGNSSLRVTLFYIVLSTTV